VNFLSHSLSLFQGGEQIVVGIVLSKEEKKVMIMGKNPSIPLAEGRLT
jgi:hypothetical protein